MKNNTILFLFFSVLSSACFSGYEEAMWILFSNQPLFTLEPPVVTDEDYESKYKKALSSGQRKNQETEVDTNRYDEFINELKSDQASPKSLHMLAIAPTCPFRPLDAKSRADYAREAHKLFLDQPEKTLDADDFYHMALLYSFPSFGLKIEKEKANHYFKKAEEAYQLTETETIKIKFRLALCYLNLNKTADAKKLILQAIEKGFTFAAVAFLQECSTQLNNSERDNYIQILQDNPHLGFSTLKQQLQSQKEDGQNPSHQNISKFALKSAFYFDTDALVYLAETGISSDIPMSMKLCKQAIDYGCPNIPFSLLTIKNLAGKPQLLGYEKSKIPQLWEQLKESSDKDILWQACQYYLGNNQFIESVSCFERMAYFQKACNEEILNFQKTVISILDSRPIDEDYEDIRQEVKQRLRALCSG